MSEKILLDDGWLFHEGDLKTEKPVSKGPMYMGAKTERFLYGPASRHYVAVPDDYSLAHEVNPDVWQKVNLPHDYVICHAPDKKYNNALGYFPYNNAWYRKTFTLDRGDRDKRLLLRFDGIANEAVVYVNGCLLKHNFGGYTGFEVDITDFAEFEDENVLAVYVKTEKNQGWWYEGGGIYRHVWLVKSNMLSVDTYGIHVIPQKKNDVSWCVEIRNTIRNDSFEDEQVAVESVILNGEKAVLCLRSENTIPARSKKTVALSGAVQNPHLWNIDDPHQYKVKTCVCKNGSKTDEAETKFGFRTYSFDRDEGMFINGKHVVIKGVCAHQDFGLTGKAVPDNILRHKVKLIREMGANGFRCSHYPHPEATMDALDDMGFIVMAETRWFSSAEENMDELEWLIKRDRNRPSVFFWSIGNEEPRFVADTGLRIAKAMIHKVKSLDNTRTVVAAVDRPSNAVVYDELDAAGINYNLSVYDEIQAKYRDKPIFSSENCATGSVRGWYFANSEENGRIGAYDRDTSTWFLGREKTQKFLDKRKWVFGGYQWAAFEHRGECVWPRLCSVSGAIDLFLQKKDAFYQNQSFWIEDRPILHLMPHWNFEGLEGEEILVVAYTNLPETELFLNGKSLGKKQVEQFGHAEWRVPYTAGEIRAVGYKYGKAAAEDIRKTAGKPIALCLKSETESVFANGQDIALVTCYCTDENGAEVPTAVPTVSFSANELGTVVGTGSDICDHTPVTESMRKMYAGRISVAVRTKEQRGTLKVYAEAQGLRSAVLNINLK